MPIAGGPASVAVPSPLSVKVTPEGRTPLATNVAFGTPLVVTVNVFDAPTTHVAAAALVKVGG